MSRAEGGVLQRWRQQSKSTGGRYIVPNAHDLHMQLNLKYSQVLLHGAYDNSGMWHSYQMGLECIIVLSLQPQIEWLKYQSLSFPKCKYRIRTTDHCITCLTPRGIPGPFVPKRFETRLRDWGGEKRGGEEVFNQVLSFQCQKISHKQTHPSKGSYCRLAHCKKEGGHEASLIRNCGISCRYPQPTHFSPSAAAAAELKACG